MSCDNQFRHVCLKDLDNYIKRDTYFSDFSKEEIKQIQENLGIVTKDDWNTDYNPTILSGTYEQIHNQQILGNLKPGFIYVITNYRTIYYDCDNVICGTDANQPSQEYWIFLKPISTNMFDKRVSLFQQVGNSMCSKWIVEYDINIFTKNHLHRYPKKHLSAAQSTKDTGIGFRKTFKHGMEHTQSTKKSTSGEVLLPCERVTKRSKIEIKVSKSSVSDPFDKCEFDNLIWHSYTKS